ncbi:hypothetical protein IW140_005390 [Coemansia sp. RSA 1813]|nr:hypothetical protein LPJ74_004392 [Coemansia sp. RSA 1843]KAJ2086656.1 hypothetical protein IW138_005527 [Coemansia sp. RSA 986]KAJ2211445.1 hypothetical protein EV179_005487 [Coemansia sp. RSA 487]KAJ2565277.1 hypothetical protein IW140_005390 [Coemansia sp. RSA 1813]
MYDKEDRDAAAGSTETRLTIEKLLHDVRQRRQQAMRLVELAEQSMYAYERDQGAERERGSESDIDEEEYWDAGGAELAIVDAADTESVESSSGSCPPDSFLEGFTREFVDSYKPSSAAVLSPEFIAGLRDPKHFLVASGSANQQRTSEPRGTLPDVALFPSSPAERKPNHPPPSVEQNPISSPPLHFDEPVSLPPLTLRKPAPPSPTAMRETPISSPSVVQDIECSPPPAARQVQETRICHPRGVAVIDTKARRRLWDRMAVAADADRRDDDEQKIERLVRMAEALGIEQTVSASTRSRGQPLVPPSIPASNKEDRHASSDQEKPSNTHASDTQHSRSHWQPQEWMQWGEVVAEHAQQTLVDRDEMVRRLDRIHEMHPDAWLHGFCDLAMANGKLQRTYSTQPVVLHAYPDGNIKRTVLASDTTATGDALSLDAAAVTLYYSNGDWSCSVPGRCCYYYYSDERVWHEQYEDGRSVEYPLGL